MVDLTIHVRMNEAKVKFSQNTSVKLKISTTLVQSTLSTAQALSWGFLYPLSWCRHLVQKHLVCILSTPHAYTHTHGSAHHVFSLLVFIRERSLTGWRDGFVRSPWQRPQLYALMQQLLALCSHFEPTVNTRRCKTGAGTPIHPFKVMLSTAEA